MLVVITDCSSNNPNFQWYRDKIGQMFETNDSFNKSFPLSRWYQVIEFFDTSPVIISSYIDMNDCMKLEDYRIRQIEKILK